MESLRNADAWPPSYLSFLGDRRSLLIQSIYCRYFLLITGILNVASPALQNVFQIALQIVNLRKIEFFKVFSISAEYDWLVEGNGARVLVCARHAIAFEFADLYYLVSWFYWPLQPLTLLSQLRVLELEDLIHVLEIVLSSTLSADDGAGGPYGAHAWRWC